MLKFILDKESKRGGGIFMALTHSSQGRPRIHPVKDDTYVDGTSDGSLFTHHPKRDQDVLAIKSEINDDIHYMAYSNAQTEGSLDVKPFKTLKHSDNMSTLLRKIGNAIRYSDDSRIYFQDTSGSKRLNMTFNNLSKNEAKKLGFSDEKFNEIQDERSAFKFESESLKDIWTNQRNNALRDYLGEEVNSQAKFSLDCNNISNTVNFNNMRGIDIIEKISRARLLRNEYTLTDEEISSLISEDYLQATNLNVE